jgi:hypothetical protein
VGRVNGFVVSNIRESATQESKAATSPTAARVGQCWDDEGAGPVPVWAMASANDVVTAAQDGDR